VGKGKGGGQRVKGNGRMNGIQSPKFCSQTDKFLILFSGATLCSERALKF
jgi:hypothetical protein